MPKRLKMNLQFFADPEEEKKDNVDEPETPATPEPTPTTADNDIAKMLMDIQGLLANMQQTMDKLAPVSEEPPASDPPDDETPEEPPAEEPSEEKIKEIDRLLQSE
jgi:hypothetical protein